MNALAKRYTQALTLGATLKEVELFAEIFQGLASSLEEKKTKDLFFSPFMNANEKESILLAAVASVKNEKINNLIRVLVEKNRLNVLTAIANSLVLELERMHNSYRGVIESNIALEKSMQKEFATNFSKKVDANVTFEMKKSSYDGVKISVDSLGLEVGFSKSIVRNQMIQHILKSI